MWDTQSNKIVEVLASGLVQGGNVCVCLFDSVLSRVTNGSHVSDRHRTLPRPDLCLPTVLSGVLPFVPSFLGQVVYSGHGVGWVWGSSISSVRSRVPMDTRARVDTGGGGRVPSCRL